MRRLTVQLECRTITCRRPAFADGKGDEFPQSYRRNEATIDESDSAGAPDGAEIIPMPVSEFNGKAAIRRDFAVVAITFWIVVNAILYWWLDSSRPDNSLREPDTAVLAAYHEHTIKAGNTELGYRLAPPINIVEGQRYPLLVYLHGAGEVGSDNRRQLNGLPSLMVTSEYRERFDGFVLAPQCPERAKWTTAIVALTHADAFESMTMAMPAIDDVIADHPIDPQRVYLSGFSMGGYGTWALAAQRPELFAAIVPVCGGGDPATAPKLVELPIWAVHGGQDKVVPPEQSRLIVDAIIAAGGRPRLTILPDAGHETKWAYALDSGVLDWMFEQRRSD